MADQERVDIRSYDIIYRVTEDIEKAVQGLLEPTQRDVLDGRAEVRAIFDLGRSRKIAGIYVLEGILARNRLTRVLRAGQELYDGPVGSLRHYKDDVRSLGSGYEGGISFEQFQDFQEGDILEAHHSELGDSKVTR